MKHLIAAAATAPLLIACASAGAQTAASEAEAQTRVLVVNGERIVLSDGADAASAIEEALERSAGSRRIVLEFDGDAAPGWNAEAREAFAAAMAELAEVVSEDFEGAFDFDFDFDIDREAFAWNSDDDERIDIMVRRIERHAERHAERVEREAARLERNAERMARGLQRHAARAEVHGLRAGVRGVESGLAGVERVLERGWYEEDGERVELTDERRAELEDTRAELLETLEELRADLAEAEARHGGVHREVRIVRRDGETRGWLNGEEVTGSELDRLLEGAPAASEAPETPGEEG